MKKRFVAAAVIAAVLAAVFVGGCTGKKDQAAQAGGAGTVKIAVALPMTGDNAEYGKSFLTAAQIMAEKWNNAGGVLGFTP